MITYKTNPERIINIIKDNISSLKNSKLTNYTEDSVQLKNGQFNFTINLKLNNDETTVLIDWDFTPIGNQKTSGLENIGGKKWTNEIIKFIDSHLNEDEKTENSKSVMISIEKSKKNNMILYGILLVFCVVGGWWIGGGFDVGSSKSSSSSSSSYKSSSSSRKTENTDYEKKVCKDAYGNWHSHISTCATCGTSYCVEYLSYGKYCSQGCCRAIENYPSSKCGD